MNTLTQQQINQYQWRVADGAAVPVNPIPYNVLDENWVNKASELLPIIYHTNAPDGIYSGEAFELEYQGLYESGWFKISELLYRNYVSTSIDLLVEDTRLFLRLKPSHLPAVLTTQPREEWKDMYKAWLISLTQKDAEMPVGYDYVIPYLNCGVWRVEYRLITPSAEQEAETVVYNDIQYPSIADALWDWYSRLMVPADSEDAPEDLIEPLIDKNILLEKDFKDAIQHLQSTLTQKDQRIAELEREREWISVDERKPIPDTDYNHATEYLVKSDNGMYRPYVGIAGYLIGYGVDENEAQWLVFADQHKVIEKHSRTKVTHWKTPPQH